MDYKKKSLKRLNRNESYEEIDTRLASGWYVDTLEGDNRKKYKTKKVAFKIAKKSDWPDKKSIRKLLKNLLRRFYIQV